MKKARSMLSVILILLFALSVVQPAYADEAEEVKDSITSETESAIPDSLLPNDEEEPTEQETDPSSGDEQEKKDGDSSDETNVSGAVIENEEESAPENAIILDGKLIEDPVYVILNGRETLWLSIGKAELREYVNFFRNEMNMNSAAIAGVLANIQCESGFDPNMIGDYGNSYGLCQWRETRLDALVEFCDREGLSPITAEGQLRFIQEEFNNYYKFIGDVVLNIDDSAEGAYWCAHYFCYHYEAPADPDLAKQDRQKIAKELLYPLLVEWENN